VLIAGHPIPRQCDALYVVRRGAGTRLRHRLLDRQSAVAYANDLADGRVLIAVTDNVNRAKGE